MAESPDKQGEGASASSGAAQTPIADLLAACLEHYERVSTVAHEWHNQVPQAIRAWYAAKAAPSANQRITEAEGLLRECVEGLVTDCTAWNRKVRKFLNTAAQGETSEVAGVRPDQDAARPLASAVPCSPCLCPHCCRDGGCLRQREAVPSSIERSKP